jgi:uncharacterized protein (DUF433 family)
MSSRDLNTVVAAFTEDQTAKLTNVSVRQLRYWDSSKFFVPSLASPDRRQSFARLYSFRDLLCLKVLNTLRNESRVSMQHLKKVKEKLAHLGEDLWSKTTLYVLNRKVVFVNPQTSEKEEVVSGQGVLSIALEVVTGNMREAVEKLRSRDESRIGRVERHKGVANNRPVIAGTRIPVQAIREFGDAGYSIERIMKEYPSLKREDIEAALNYGAAA